MPATEPLLPASIYAERLERLRTAMDERGYDHLVVWADREHSANLAYLTGFDPRFEEAVLVVGPSGRPGAARRQRVLRHWPRPRRCRCAASASRTSACPASHATRRRRSPRSSATRASAPGSRVGVVGWKTYASRDDDRGAGVPRRRAAPGDRAVGLVENATDLLIDAADGLRVINEVEQLAAFEWAACQTSNGVRRLLAGLQPGMTEREAVRLLEWNGAPLSCHLMLTAGPRARFGLLSPGDRPIERGDPFTIAFGIWGALNCRAGFVVEDAVGAARRRSPTTSSGSSRPYFAAVAEWYEALHVGQVGGALQAIVDRHLGDPFFGISLNPGHQLHLDEWVNSPVFPGSTIELRSGMALQCDIIPATGTPYFTTNIEDGVALADESLRAAFAAAYPEAWARIQARRAFMIEPLGIDLHPDVLPFSNLAAHLPPFLLRPDRAMTMAHE